MATTHSSRLGACPFCDADVDAADAIIEYEVDDRPAVYAECPECNDVVNPE